MEKFDIKKEIEKTREFDQETTFDFIKSFNAIPMSWGISEVKSYENKALLFRVNGFIHKGKVVILLNVLDYFDVYLLKDDGVVVKKIHDVFISDLVEVIDRNVERTENYKEDVENWLDNWSKSI